MKKLFLLLLLLIPIVTAQIEIDGFVNDYADILTYEQELQLQQIATDLYDAGQVQYAIVTINSLEGQDIESYSLNLAQGNLGDGERNDGLLLLVSVEDRKYRFEVGRGIEYILNDAKVGRIGRYALVPNFKQQQYFEGIYEASTQIKQIFGNESYEPYDEYGDSNEGTWNAIVWIFIVLYIFSIITRGFFKRRRHNRFFNAAYLASNAFAHTGSAMGRSFGGGSFGGGGSSGGW